jgi:hypothetical protein
MIRKSEESQEEEVRALKKVERWDKRLQGSDRQKEKAEAGVEATTNTFQILFFFSTRITLLKTRSNLVSQKFQVFNLLVRLSTNRIRRNQYQRKGVNREPPVLMH